MLAKKIVIAILICICCVQVHAQDAATAQVLINEGIKLHDAGDYKGAISKYRQALITDVDNVNALYEMSFTFYAEGEYDSSIMICKELINLKAPDAILKNVYVNLGSAYDDINKPDDAIDAYEQGIKKFPGFYLLYFNKGITLYFQKRIKEARQTLQTAVDLNPMHPGSHYWLAQILQNQNRVPAILAASMVCIIDSNSKRAVNAAIFVDSLLLHANNVEQKDSGKQITIYLPPVNKDEKKKENDFAFVELGLSMMQVSKTSDTIKLDTHEKLFSYNYNMLCGLLDNYKKYKGFYWAFYAQFFSEAKKKDYDDIIVHLILQHIDGGESALWLKAHRDDVNNFYDWLHNFQW